MSDGGLLQKAMEQQETGVAEIVADAVPVAEEGSSSLPLSKIASTLAVGVVLPLLLLMWFGIYLDFIQITILTPLVIIGSFAFVWWKLGVGTPSRFGGTGVESTAAFAIVGTFLILLGTPFLLATILTGEMSVGDVEFDAQGEVMNIKIRQNGGSGSYDADIVIEQNNAQIWSGSETFSIDRSDGSGDYGLIMIDVQEFYNSNALPLDSTAYKLKISIEGRQFTKNLDSNILTRTVTASASDATASMTTDSDSCGNKDRCVKGVALTASAGLAAAAGFPLGPMPNADYTIKTTMYYETTSLAIDYPMVTVDSTSATWDSNGAEFGSGNGIIGLEGSSLPLDGSEFASDLQAIIIPIDAWDQNDYGCYSVVVEISQSAPWAGPAPISGVSHYMFEEQGNQDDGFSETWTEVDSC